MKTKTIAVVLALIVGGLGIHKFYLGRTASGVLYLLFFWTGVPFFLALCDALAYIIMSRETFDERYNWLRLSMKSSHSPIPQ